MLTVVRRAHLSSEYKTQPETAAEERQQCVAAWPPWTRRPWPVRARCKCNRQVFFLRRNVSRQIAAATFWEYVVRSGRRVRHWLRRRRGADCSFPAVQRAANSTSGVDISASRNWRVLRLWCIRTDHGRWPTDPNISEGAWLNVNIVYSFVSFAHLLANSRGAAPRQYSKSFIQQETWSIIPLSTLTSVMGVH